MTRRQAPLSGSVAYAHKLPPEAPKRKIERIGVCDECGEHPATHRVGGGGMPVWFACGICWARPRPTPMLSLRSAR